MSGRRQRRVAKMYLNRKNGNHQMREDKVLGITGHIEKTPYNPRSDGQVRKQMSTLKNQPSACVNEHHDNWDERIAERW
jgi:hypothetical protein